MLTMLNFSRKSDWLPGNAARRAGHDRRDRRSSRGRFPAIRASAGLFGGQGSVLPAPRADASNQRRVKVPVRSFAPDPGAYTSGTMLGFHRHTGRLARCALRGLSCVLLGAPFPGMAAGVVGYPTHPIRLIVPYTPGGIVDIVARITARALEGQLGQSVVVDNRSGAGGTIGMKALVAAAPDGYTLGIATTGPLAIMPALQPSAAYDPLHDFTPVSLVATASQLLLVHPALAVHSVQELVSYARLHPGQLAYASAGVGTTGHLAGALFEALARVQLLHVPYTGNQGALRDVLSGRVQILFSPLAPVRQDIRTGKLRALVVAGAARSPLLPDVPTIAEAGLPGGEAPVWYGIVAPANMPPAIVDRLHRALRAAGSDGKFLRQLADAGVDSDVSTPDAFRRLIADENVKWKRIVKERGIRAE
jgi:tripartite-type tricarboxylate transporter receptor subunit TctC